MERGRGLLPRPLAPLRARAAQLATAETGFLTTTACQSPTMQSSAANRTHSSQSVGQDCIRRCRTSRDDKEKGKRRLYQITFKIVFFLPFRFWFGGSGRTYYYTGCSRKQVPGGEGGLRKPKKKKKPRAISYICIYIRGWFSVGSPFVLLPEHHSVSCSSPAQIKCFFPSLPPETRKKRFPQFVFPPFPPKKHVAAIYI